MATQVTLANSAVQVPSSCSFICPQCKKTAEKLLRCSRCHFEEYCGQECQRAHFPTHKTVCRLIDSASKEWKEGNKRTNCSPNPYWKTAVYLNITPLLVSTLDSMQEGKLALDLGCGSGTDSVFLLQRGWKVIAIDYFKDPLDRLQATANTTNAQWIKEGRLAALQEDVDQYVFPENVDLIVASDLFPYLDPLKLGSLWNKMYRALNENGRLIGSFFDRNSTCRIYGAWCVNDIDSVRAFFAKESYEIEVCQYRVKRYQSSIIEFSVKKTIQK